MKFVWFIAFDIIIMDYTECGQVHPFPGRWDTRCARDSKRQLGGGDGVLAKALPAQQRGHGPLGFPGCLPRSMAKQREDQTGDNI